MNKKRDEENAMRKLEKRAVLHAFLLRFAIDWKIGIAVI